jgi:hypothetical protein
MCLRHKGAVSSPDPGLFLAHPPLTDRVPHLLAFLLSCSRYHVPHIPRSLLLVTIGDMPTFLGVHIGVECARAGRHEVIDHLWKDAHVRRVARLWRSTVICPREAVWALVVGSLTSSPRVECNHSSCDSTSLTWNNPGCSESYSAGGLG